MITITVPRAVLEQALEALEGGANSWSLVGPAIDALLAVLSQKALDDLAEIDREIGLDYMQPDLDTAAELRRLRQHELANNLWHEKTAWVQETVQPDELGMHRADVLKQRIDRLHAVNQELLEALRKTESALSRCLGAHKAEEGDRHRALAQARAAIAKAEGGQG